MTHNKRKTYAVAISTAFLLLAVFDGWPYGFFTLLRFVVCASTAYVAWLAYEDKQEKWAWVFGLFAVIFNPFIPLYLGRAIWVVVDLIVAVFLLFSLFVFKLSRQAKDQHPS